MSDFEVKDSGKREEFASGMVRDTNEGKLKPHLIRSGPMFKRWIAHLTKGAEKYSDDNWMKANGIPEYQRFKESAQRHFEQWLDGDTDEDHAAAVFFNINGAEYVRHLLELPSEVGEVRSPEEEEILVRLTNHLWEYPSE